MVGARFRLHRHGEEARLGESGSGPVVRCLMEGPLLRPARTLNSGCGQSSETPGARESLSLAFYCPVWPPGAANGIVTYIGTIVAGLQAQGHVVSLISPSVTRGTTAEGIYSLDEYHTNRTLPDRLLDRLARFRGPDQVLARGACRAIAAATRRAVAERGVQLLEMEETFGWPLDVRPRIPIPLVVRLHGPWFLNGLANGCSIDASFHARIRKEGRALRAADGITAPSLDVLERTRSYYGLALEHAEVIPNPVPAPPTLPGGVPRSAYLIRFSSSADLIPIRGEISSSMPSARSLNGSRKPVSDSSGWIGASRVATAGIGRSGTIPKGGSREPGGPARSNGLAVNPIRPLPPSASRPRSQWSVHGMRSSD